MNLLDADTSLMAAAKFDPNCPLDTMEDVRERLSKGYVVYQHQFKAFVDAYDKMTKHLSELHRLRPILNAWARANKRLIAEQEREEQAK